MHKKAKLKEFEEQSGNIISKMVLVLSRAQRKVDDKAYRETLEKLKHI